MSEEALTFVCRYRTFGRIGFAGVVYSRLVWFVGLAGGMVQVVQWFAVMGHSWVVHGGKHIWWFGDFHLGGSSCWRGQGGFVGGHGLAWLRATSKSVSIVAGLIVVQLSGVWVHVVAGPANG